MRYFSNLIFLLDNLVTFLSFMDVGMSELLVDCDFLKKGWCYGYASCMDSTLV
jgi:hypothetical protein